MLSVFYKFKSYNLSLGKSNFDILSISSLATNKGLALVEILLGWKCALNSFIKNTNLSGFEK
jgi:hypothetical protein